MCTDQYLPLLGGVTDSVAALVKGLKEEGHTVRVFAPNMHGAPKDPDVVHMPTMTIGGMFNFVAPFGLLRELREFKPDVIHAQALGILTICAIRAARKLRVPVVGTCHGFPADYLQYFYLNFPPFPYLAHKFTAAFFDTCDIVTAPSQQPFATLRQYGTRREMRVVSNSLDVVTFSPMDKHRAKQAFGIGEKAVMLFGRIAVEKNLDHAVRIFADVAQKCAAQLVIIGDGPYRSELLSKIEEAGLTKKTKFLGRLGGAQLVQALNACDVMLATSRMEVQPMTILQANACAIPVVGARAGGIPECIEDGVTGFLVEPDDTDAFSAHILHILNSENTPSALGIRAHERVMNFAPRKIAAQFGDIYKHLAHEAKDQSTRAGTLEK